MSLVIIGVLFLAFTFVYNGLDVKMQILLFVVDLFLPDPIPYIDEVVMCALMLKNLGNSKE